MLRTVFGSLALILALLGCTSSSDSQQRTVPGSATQSSESPSTTSASARTRCEFASVRPTYLPWLKRGEEIPTPRTYRGPDDAAWLDWRRPDWEGGDDAPYYVVLRRDSQFTTSSGELVPGTRIREAVEAGRLYSGEVGFSPSIVWFLVDASSCEWLTLQLSAPGMSRERAEEEIVKIAKSLQSAPPIAAASQLVPASAELLANCRATADSVGYPVPCPIRVPAGLTATRGQGGCKLDVLGPGGIGGCARAWRNWVIGSSETNDQHLVIVASPRALRNYAKVVNGPGWYPSARVRLLRWLTIKDWRVRAVYVPFGTNDGSAFARHVVLIWTVGDHTYGVGFHDVYGLRKTLDLDVALARGVSLVAPKTNS